MFFTCNHLPVVSPSVFCPTEYGFLFSFGGVGLAQPAAQPISDIQRMILKSHTPSAIQNQSNLQPKTKCIASNIHAGIVHSMLTNILNIRQAKNSPNLFIDYSFLLTPTDPEISVYGYRGAKTAPTRATVRRPSF